MRGSSLDLALLDFSSPSEDHPRPIYARSGWKIPQPPLSHIEEEIENMRDVHDETRRCIRLMQPRKRASLAVRSVSQHLYSCVGMVFANRRAWLEIDQILRILHEDGYSRVVDHRTIVRGDVVLYCDRVTGKPAHVGIVTQIDRVDGSVLKNVRVLSKWGRAGEVEHSVQDVPDFCGVPHSYWSERVAPDV